MANIFRTVRSMSGLFLGMGLLFVGNGLLISSASIELKKMGTDELTIGLINTAYFFGAALSTILSHRIVSRVGHIRSFGIFTIVFGICAMFHSLSHNLIFWSFLRFGLGFCYYGILMVIESWLNERTQNSVRSRVLAVYEVVFYTGFGLGVIIMGIGLSSVEIFIISASFIMISSIPLNLIRIKEPKIPQKQSVCLPKIFSVVPLALASAVVGGILINGFFSMAGLFVMLKGFNVSEISIFIFTAMMGGFCGHFVLGPLSDKFGRKIAIIFCCIVSFLASLAFLCLKLDFIMQLIFAFCLGSGAFCLYTLALARANDVVTDKTKIIEVSRALLFSYSLSALISPTIMGMAMKVAGANGFMLVYSVCLLFLLIFAITQRSIPAQNRSNFEPHIVRTTAIDDINTSYNKNG